MAVSLLVRADHQIFSTALNDSIIQKLSAAQAVPHTSLESLLFVIQLRRELVTVLSATSREVIGAHEIVKSELTKLLEREQVTMRMPSDKVVSVQSVVDKRERTDRRGRTRTG